MRSGLVVSALNFQSESRWFEPSLCRHVVSLDKKLYFILSLFTQVYKWVLVIIMLGGVALQWSSILSRGGNSNVPSHFMLQKPELKGLCHRFQHLFEQPKYIFVHRKPTNKGLFLLTLLLY